MFLAYYCDTQKQSPGEFAGKQLCRSLFFSKVAVRSKKRFRDSEIKQSIATCTSYSFLHATTVSLIKLIFCMKNKKAADLKLQQRISKKSSFSRYLENAKF